MMRTIHSILLALSAAALSACGDHAPAARESAATAPLAGRLSLAARVGEKMFFDVTLSGSGKMSCANCHDPDAAHAAPNDLAVQLGGTALTIAGARAAPSLRY